MGGIVQHHYFSLYSFVMGALWFSTFILLGLLVRRLKFPIRFSAIPLILLLVLSVFRVSVFVIMPNAMVFRSHTWYPMFADFMRGVPISSGSFGFSVVPANVFLVIWIIVGAWLFLNYAFRYLSGFFPFLLNFNKHKDKSRDRHAESLLAEIIGADKHIHVYRDSRFSTAVSTAIKPYIILPEIEMPDECLKVILVHEWKHIVDRDYLSEIAVNLVCFVFWWNPLVYLFRKHYRFAREVKCDHVALNTEADLFNLLDGMSIFQSLQETKYASYNGFNMFVKTKDEFTERLEVIASKIKDEKVYGKSRFRRFVTNVSSSAVIIALFIASYFIIILPVTFESPYIDVLAEHFTEEYQDTGGVFRSDGNYIVDNSDGTFSLYIHGLFVMYVDPTNELLEWLPVRQR